MAGRVRVNRVRAVDAVVMNPSVSRSRSVVFFADMKRSRERLLRMAGTRGRRRSVAGEDKPGGRPLDAYGHRG